MDTGKESIVIIDNFQSIRGGKTLDVTGLAADVIEAGHVIIKDTVSGDYKPMPVSDAAYAALPASHEYAGILIASVLKAKPFAAIMVRGTVNQAAAPYSITADIKTALPLIYFTQD